MRVNGIVPVADRFGYTLTCTAGDLSCLRLLAVLHPMKLSEQDVQLRLQLSDAPKLSRRVRPQYFDGALQVGDYSPGGFRTSFSAWPSPPGLAADSTRAARPGFANWATFTGLPRCASSRHLDAGC